MAHHFNDSEEKVVYVGDSRVRKYTKNNVPQDYSAYPGKTEAFVPNFLLKEWMVGAVFMVGYMALIIAHPAPLGYPADPTNTAFIPMPDWYFLFMYQLLKYPYTSDQFILFGTAILPGLMFGGLMLAPFLDRGKERRFYRRPLASAFMFLSIIATIYLTMVSWHHYQEELALNNIIPQHIKREAELKKLAAEGKEPPKAGQEAPVTAIVDENNEAFTTIYQKSTCIACHATDLQGTPKANIPGLRGVGDIHSKEEIITIMKEGYNTMLPDQWNASIKQGLTEADMEKLADWLSKQKADVGETSS